MQPARFAEYGTASPSMQRQQQPQQSYRGVGRRSNTGSIPTGSITAANTPTDSTPTGSVSYSPVKSYSRDETRAGAISSPTQHSIATAIPMTTHTKKMPNLMHAKLHKRGGSGSSPSLQQHARTITTTIPTPVIKTTEPFPDHSTTPAVQSSPVAKVKPYLRKLSSTKDDQGRIDLSKSLAENEKLAGLGIQDFSQRSSAEGVYAPASGRISHARTTSVGSQMSSSSGSFRPQPFIHPMRQAPRPFTPPNARSHIAPPQEDEDDEFIDDGHRPSYTFRPRRSMSSSSAQVAPTPLSQTINLADLGAFPRLYSASQSNLSIISTRSSKPTGSRRNTGRSTEIATSPSSRTSFDRTLSLGTRRSDTESQTRDERIQAARRKFQEKEADKDRKAEKDAVKRREAEEAKEQRRQERQRRISDASERSRVQRPVMGIRTSSALGRHNSSAYETQPTSGAVLQSDYSEKQQGPTWKPAVTNKPGFLGRLFSCGTQRK